MFEELPHGHFSPEGQSTLLRICIAGINLEDQGVRSGGIVGQSPIGLPGFIMEAECSRFPNDCKSMAQVGSKMWYMKFHLACSSYLGHEKVHRGRRGQYDAVWKTMGAVAGIWRRRN